MFRLQTNVNNMKFFPFFLSGLMIFLNVQGIAQITKMPTILSDHMVLQQRATIHIWGWAKPGTELVVKGSWGQGKAQGVVDSTGKWDLKIPTVEAGGPYELTIKASLKKKKQPKEDTTIVYSDVYLGEVWVCSGQSNMEWPVRRADNAEAEIKTADFPLIRLFTVKKKYSKEPLEDVEGQWESCSPETVADFSAVGYYFGRDIHQKMEVPVGLIHSSWGGTRIEAWMSAIGLNRIPEYENEWNNLQELKKNEAVYRQTFDSVMNVWMANVLDKMGGTTRGGSTDEGEWKNMTLPQLWEDAGLKGFDGSIWFRKKVDIPESWTGKDLTLSLGPIDDMDVSWFNEEKVGGYETMGHYATPRIYTVPATAVKAGNENIILIKAMDTGGGGGLNGRAKDMHLSIKGSENGEQIALSGEWEYKIAQQLTDIPAAPQMPLLEGPNAATNLYNGMIFPIIPYGINGVLWYQGESNASESEMYKILFPNMIKDWRFRWNIGDFSFFFVQIAPFKYGQPLIGAKLREAQLEGLEIRNTGMAVTMDIGDPDDIHPTNKQEVGKRLGLLAMNKTFGYRDVVSSGPIYNFMKIEGGKIRLYFQNIDGGLRAKEEKDELTHFQIAGKDRIFYPAKAIIQGETIVVSSDQVPAPAAVRYGFTNDATPNLYNGAGLPASSFRTDKW